MATPYQPGIPTGRVFLSIDYTAIQQNFASLNTSFGMDHTALTLSDKNGYHQAVHLVPQTTGTYPPNPAPATVAGVATLFSSIINDGYNTDTALYFLTGNGLLSQLTSNFAPSSAQNGTTFLPGGVVMQWGTVALTSAASQTGTVTFATSNRNFATACYTVTVSLVRNLAVGSSLSPGNTIVVNNGTANTNGFGWTFSGISNQIVSFYWLAIGK